VDVDMDTDIKERKVREMRRKWILGLFNNAILTIGNLSSTRPQMKPPV
jgi:hypothetical protein